MNSDAPGATASDPATAERLLRDLRASEARFRTAFEGSIMGLVICDLKGIIHSANDAFCQIVGHSREEVVGHDTQHITHPDDRRQNVNFLQRIENGQITSHTFQKRYIRKDGAVVWTQINLSLLPETEDGQPFLIATIEDITGQILARKALTESEQHLRLIFESLRDYAIMTVDPDGLVTSWNSGAERIFGYTAAEIVGKDSSILWIPEHREQHFPSTERETARKQGHWTGERWQQRKDGTRFFASGTLRPMLDEAGAIVGFIKVCQDITARRESSRLLAAAQEKIAAVQARERERLADVFKRSPSFMAVLHGPDHLFELANDEFYNVVGQRPIIGKKLHDALPELHDQDIHEILDRVFASAEPYEGKNVAIQLQRHADTPPEERYVDFVFLPTRDAEGTTTGVFVHGVDQTERRLAEQRLATLAEQRRVALDAADMGWWHLDVLSGNASWDPRVKEILGVDADQLNLDAIFKIIHPQDCPSLKAAISASLDIRHPQPYQAEFRVIHPGGAIRWVQARGRAYFATRPSPRAISLVGTVMDITKARQAQDTLRENEARFRQLADAMPQIVFMADPEGNVDYFNKKWYEYTGFAEGGFGFEHWKPVHDEDGLRRALIAWPEAVRTGAPYEIEYRLRRHDGAYRWHLGRALPIRNRDGQIVRWFGTNTDIHDYKELQQEHEKLLHSERTAREQAELANRVKDEFLATLSHELRTPLSSILGWCSILSAEPPNPEDLAGGLEIIERNARAQAQIIDDLLDMSSIISGKIRLNVQHTDLASVVQTAVEIIRPAADAKGVRLHTVLDPLARPVSGDPNRLQQIFWNLLSNAVKFTPKGGRIQVLLERVNSHLELSVSDTGEGIAPDFLPMVFDRFRQADASITRRHGGLGLGLAIVKQLVELHGGSVRVKSGGPGLGSTFTVSLPLTILHHEHPARDHNDERRHPQAGSTTVPIPTEILKLDGVKVLVVDDERDARTLIRRFLEDHRASVRTARSAAEALALIQQELPDVLVSDIGMPGEDGYTLIRKVRALPPERGGSVPAIALTAYARSEDRMKAVVAGFQMHVAKPAEAAELLTMVASLAGRMNLKITAESGSSRVENSK